MNNLKPWREVAVPHPDVLEGTFLQSEFAADITAVQTGKASREYQEAQAFFQRTYITEGMRILLVSVAHRLSGQGGEPVIQLQTSFGGGKTHTMLAVYHLATRSCPISDLNGVSAVLDQANLVDIPKARVAILDGINLAPGQARQRGKYTIRTLWGELAWQLGGEGAFELIRASDENGTSPGKELLVQVLQTASPCVILVDELVAYIRQFEPGKSQVGGTYDANLSFLQALTEAVKLVPTAILLASLPESDVEAGSNQGIAVLRALEKTFGRVQAIWKPVATEEAFEIVRRRLFQDINNQSDRDSVCSSFATAYVSDMARFPSETQESRYLNRLQRAYPIHPEFFDRLYEDWATLEGFQRTRGVLKLMAKVIYRLWKDSNQDYLIMPGSIPLYDSNSRTELSTHLGPGWDPVIDRDIDGDRSETVELEVKETRFGSINAARRVARTLFLGSAPSTVALKSGIRGLDRERILLGCVQPGQSAAVYLDALNRLADRLHYLNANGDKSQDNTRFWFDTRATLRREMEDRKARFDDKTIRESIASGLRSISKGSGMFDGIHVFSNHADVPDDSALRLVFLSPSKWYSVRESRIAFEEVKEYLRNHGMQPRHRANRLLFVAADDGVYSRMVDATRTALAWQSIVDDIKSGRLNVDGQQSMLAQKAFQQAQDTIPGSLRECYKWLLCPVQDQPTSRDIEVETYPIPTSGAGYM